MDHLPGDAVERLAGLLARVQFPGVVTLEGVDGSGDDAVLRLADGLPDLTERPPRDAASCAGLGASLARTLGELHRAGVAHGGLRPDTVLVDADGRPLLAGFEAATDDDPEGRTRDVRQLAELLAGLADALADSDDAAERRRRRRLLRALRSRRPRDAVDLSTALADLAADFAEAPPARPGDARRRLGLAEGGTTVRHLVPRPRTALLLVLLAAVVLYAVGVGRGDRPTVATDGPVVEFEGRRYQVGRAGDVAVVGDWPGPAGTCDGQDTVVLLRPGTGEVFAFSGWATAGELGARRLGTHRGAIDLDVERGGCDTLVLVDGDGRRTPLAIG